MVCLWCPSPRGWGYLPHSSGKMQTMTIDQNIRSLFLQKTHQIVGCKRKFLIVSEVRNTENVASLPPWQLSRKRLLSLECLHRADYIENLICISLKHTKTLTKKIYKYHSSLQIRTDRCCPWRGFSPLNIRTICTICTSFRGRDATVSSTAYRHSIWVKAT